MIEICPDIALGIILGMKCGLTRRGPRSCSSSCSDSMALMPPMPVPRIVPKRSRSTLVRSIALSLKHSSAAISAYCVYRSSFLASIGLKNCSAL